MPAASADTRSVRSSSNGEDFRAGPEQFRDLRDTQPASQPHETSIGLLNDADPAIHNPVEGKTQATTGRTRNGRNRAFVTQIAR